MKYLRIFILFLAGCMLLNGCSLKKQLKKADLRYENGEYYAAVGKYKRLQGRLKGKKNRTLKGEVNYKMGICYFKLSDYTRAQKAFLTAQKMKCTEDDMYLYLGKSQLAIGKFKDAKTNFNLYLARVPDSREAQEGLESTTKVALMNKGFTRFTIEEMKEFNSRSGSSCAAQFAGDDNTVVFTSNRSNSLNKKKVKINDVNGKPDNDMYISKKNKSGKWEKPATLEGSINTADDEGIATFGNEGREILFTICSPDREAGQIFKSQRNGTEWTDPTEVKLFDDSTITVGHPALSRDGNRLYFASDCDRGFGGKDLWVVEKLDNGWGIPENLGEDINTEGDEMFPYELNDSTLYFASNGHIGLGGLDLYVAIRDTAGKWQVSNLLAPVNSSWDDFGITFNSDGSEGFFSSNRNQRKQDDKIYHFHYPPLSYDIAGIITDENGEAIGEATVMIVGDNGDIVKTRARKDGSYKIILKTEAVNYVMGASKRGYLNSSYKFNTKGVQGSKTWEHSFVLASVTKSVKMDNIFYEFGKWTLTPESENGLQGLVKILTDNPNITIELSSHTDMVGTDVVNDELSQKRAQSVVDYLIKAGIDKERLTAVGYGKRKPVVVSAELAKKYRFLKEGDVLSPEFVEKLTADQQEICNTLNRRTEFKVLKTTYKLY